MMFPEAFIQRLEKDFGSNAARALLRALQTPPVVSLRGNPAKPAQLPPGEPVPWHPQGSVLGSRPSFIEDPLWHAGAYYVQEASSMFLRYVLQQLPLTQAPVVLDACAAPGGKSTLLLSALPADAILVANEVIAPRNAILRENIVRWGYPNCLVTQADPSAFSRTDELFDLVLADAPCSGEGLFRKDPASIKEWSTENTEICALRQQRILQELAPSVKSGAYLIYSTCTYNPAENFEAPSLLLAQGFEPVPLSVPAGWHIEERSSSGVTGYCFYPGQVQGEGFFISVFRKKGYPAGETTRNIRRTSKTGAPAKGEWCAWIGEPERFCLYAAGKRSYIIPRSMPGIIASLAGIRVTYAGIAAGEQKGKDYIPSHAMALSTILDTQVPRLELDRQQALQFLKKESLPGRENLSKGIYAVTYEGLALGWVKNIGNRFNNLLPAEYRIRKQLSQ